MDAGSSILQYPPGTTTTCVNSNVLMPDSIQHASDAQQAFSSSSTPTLQNALLALEKMHAAWKKASSKSRYSCFIPSLNAGMAKLDQYYNRSAESDAHIMAMGKSFLVTISGSTRNNPRPPVSARQRPPTKLATRTSMTRTHHHQTTTMTADTPPKPPTLT